MNCQSIFLDFSEIHTLEMLYDLLEERFTADGYTYFSHNLDSLEEILMDGGYCIEILHMQEFFRYFSQINGYEPMEFVQIFLDICHISIPDMLTPYASIGHYTGYHTTVYAALFFEVCAHEDIESLREVFVYATKHALPLLVIGGGTNLLFASRVFPGIIIKNQLSGRSYDPEKKILETASCELISEVAEWLENTHHEPLWHRFIGLPGSVGGAVVGNAGCFGLETASNLLDVTAYNMQTGEQEVFPKEALDFSYRHSLFKTHPEYFLISARFDLSKKVEKYASDIDNIDFRKNKQPKGYSCGSFFKNPTEFPAGVVASDDRPPSAGALIERVGLKGYRHGGARWSDLHANFLLSDGVSCAPESLIELVRMTQDRVKQETGFFLENEVRIIE